MINKNKIYNWPFIGNNQIKKYLEKNISKQKLASAYIFNGPENLGKTTVATRFAQIILCHGNEPSMPCGTCSACKSFNHGDLNSIGENFSYSDLYIVKKDKDKKNVSIEQIRDLIRAVSMSSFLGSYKIGIIKHADKMSLEAANAMLKTLEEPKEKVILILITDHLDTLPTTIKSRSQVLNFKPVSKDDIYSYLVNEKGAKRTIAKKISRISIGRPALAIKLLEDELLFKDMELHANIFFNFLNADINERLNSLSGIMQTKLSSQEERRRALRVLEVWEAVVRDFIMYKYNHMDLLQFFDADDLRARPLPTVKKIMQCYLAIKEGKLQLDANVNYKNVLDSIAMQV